MTTKDLKPDRTRRGGLFSTAVEPFKQLKIGVYVIVISLVFVAIIATIFTLSFKEQYEQVLGLFNVVDNSAKWEFILNDVFKKNAIRIAVALVSYIVILIYIIFKMTHKIYGPLVSIERFVKKIEKGDYGSRLKIRDRDDLVRLVGKLNQMSEALEKRHKKS